MMLPSQSKTARAQYRERSRKRIDGTSRDVQSGRRFLEVTRGILNSAGGGPTRAAFLSEVCDTILESTGADAIEMRHQDGAVRYRWKTARTPRAVCNFRLLTETNDTVGFWLPEQTLLEQLCQIISEPTCNTLDKLLTPNGSLWTNDVNSLVEQLLLRNAIRFPEIGQRPQWKSVAIVPFRDNPANSGIIIIMSLTAGFFASGEIESYEKMAQTFALACANRHAQWALRERIKELTCLYGIAQIADCHGLTRFERLQQIVNLLPPAMQHSEICGARIDLDGNTALTSAYRAGRYRQQANIVIKKLIRGFVEVIYTEGRPEHLEGPFLEEESSLIAEVARQVAAMIEREETNAARAALELQVRRADSLATIGQLAAGVAHELSEPLSGALGFAQLARSNVRDAEKVEKDLNKIIKIMLHARDIVSRLLSLSRQTPGEKCAVDLTELSEEILTFFEGRCSRSKINIIRQLADPLPQICGDKVEIRQLIINLIANAIQAMPDGGTLTLGTIADDSTVRLVVEDTGQGMSKEIQERIFDPFFTTKPEGHGTGLGLSVVHGIITSLGGTIIVTSSVGNGSRFEIRIPLPNSGKE